MLRNDDAWGGDVFQKQKKQKKNNDKAPALVRACVVVRARARVSCGCGCALITSSILQPTRCRRRWMWSTPPMPSPSSSTTLYHGPRFPPSARGRPLIFSAPAGGDAETAATLAGNQRSSVWLRSNKFVPLEQTSSQQQHFVDLQFFLLIKTLKMGLGIQNGDPDRTSRTSESPAAPLRVPALHTL